MKRFKQAVSIGLVIVFLILGCLSSAASDYGSYFDTMLQFMRGMYYKGLTDEEGLKAALKGMFGSLDKYSAFYTTEEMKAINSSLNGNYVGIGAGLEKSGSFVRIIKVYEGSPAEKAGILEGDLITAVNGKSVADMEADSVAAMIRGDAGTSVKLTIKRGAQTKDYTLVRSTITINPVEYRIEGKTAYIRIDSFSQGASAKFGEAMDQVNKNNIRKIILDLRGNGGGYVDEAAYIAEKLMPPGVITTLDFKSEAMTDRVYTADEAHPDYTIAVLADEGTASASEILAGALEDSGCGFLVGQKTYGKGVVQNFFPVLTPEAYKKYSEQYGEAYVSEIEWLSYYGVIPDENEILGTVKLTTGHYLTPKGRELDGVGLKPACIVANPVEPNGVNMASIAPLSNTKTMSLNFYDNQVLQAEKLLKAAGYFTATPDRQYDAATQAAVKKYQTEYRLPATGSIDVKTRDQLNKTLFELRNKHDRQYAKAAEILNWFRD